ncbi:MAG: hypothetical protein HYX92_14710 [Chloroflexi bacterium]|nr:hypothetical protein [Chloroflexota bacterium]
MGTFSHHLSVASATGNRFEEIDALVDSSATYTTLPGSLLTRLGVVAEETRPFVLADGRRVEYPIAQVRVRPDGRTRYTVAVFGEEGAQPLLGAVTLEEFGLAVDPVSKRLVPVPGLLVMRAYLGSRGEGRRLDSGLL